MQFGAPRRSAQLFSDGVAYVAELAMQLRTNLRTGDILLRWGGEKFVIILPDTSGVTASTVVARLRAQGLGKRSEGSRVTGSFGIAERLTDHAETWQRLVEIVDRCMDQAKWSGKDCSC